MGLSRLLCPTKCYQRDNAELVVARKGALKSRTNGPLESPTQNIAVRSPTADNLAGSFSWKGILRSQSLDVFAPVDRIPVVAL